MSILDNVIILTLIVSAFFVGKRIADKYAERKIEELEYQLRLMAATKGVGYVAPPQRRRSVISQAFMDRLKTEGRAVEQITRD